MAPDIPPRAEAVLSYWFGPDYAKDHPPGYWTPAEQTQLWFKGGPTADQRIKDHFADDIKELASGAYDGWLQQPLSAVAGIILADQFARHVYRGTAQAFSLDEKARQWSNEMRASWDLKAVLPLAPLRYYSYMPLMHSEELSDQELLVQLVDGEIESERQLNEQSAALASWQDVKRYAEAHRDVVARWGRFPHRNAVLGRQSTPEEEAGLQAGSIPRW